MTLRSIDQSSLVVQFASKSPELSIYDSALHLIRTSSLKYKNALIRTECEERDNANTIGHGMLVQFNARVVPRKAKNRGTPEPVT